MLSLPIHYRYIRTVDRDQTMEKTPEKLEDRVDKVEAKFEDKKRIKTNSEAKDNIATKIEVIDNIATNIEVMDSVATKIEVIDSVAEKIEIIDNIPTKIEVIDSVVPKIEVIDKGGGVIPAGESSKGREPIPTPGTSTEHRSDRCTLVGSILLTRLAKHKSMNLLF